MCTIFPPTSARGVGMAFILILVDVRKPLCLHLPSIRLLLVHNIQIILVTTCYSACAYTCIHVCTNLYANLETVRAAYGRGIYGI